MVCAHTHADDCECLQCSSAGLRVVHVTVSGSLCFRWLFNKFTYFPLSSQFSDGSLMKLQVLMFKHCHNLLCCVVLTMVRVFKTFDLLFNSTIAWHWGRFYLLKSFSYSFLLISKSTLTCAVLDFLLHVYLI